MRPATGGPLSPAAAAATSPAGRRPQQFGRLNLRHPAVQAKPGGFMASVSPSTGREPSNQGQNGDFNLLMAAYELKDYGVSIGKGAEL
jgi:hypothetical protein